MGWLVGISTRTPRTSSSLTPQPYSLSRAARPARTSAGVQGDAQTRAAAAWGPPPPAPRPAAAAPAQRAGHLLHEADLAVGGGAEGPQVARLDAVRRQRAGGPGDGEGRLAVVPGGVGPQQPERRQLGEGRPRRARPASRSSAAVSRSEDARVRSRAVGSAGSTSAAGPSAARRRGSAGPAGCSPRSRASRASRITLQRPEPVTLGGEDVAQPLDVVARRRCGSRSRCALGVDQPLGLEEPDLGDRDVREVRAGAAPGRPRSSSARGGRGPDVTRSRLTTPPCRCRRRRRAGTCRSAPRHRCAAWPRRSARG